MITCSTGPDKTVATRTKALKHVYLVAANDLSFTSILSDTFEGFCEVK